MPEIKHLFNAGRMNKDLDERLIPNGEYRDALNIQLASTDGNDAGAIQNIIGNTQISSLNLANPILIGSVVDNASNLIYWFVKDDAASYLLSYNGEIVNTIIKDVGNSAFNFGDNLVTGITLFENNIVITDNINEPYIIDINYFTGDSVRPNPTTENTQVLYNGVWSDLVTDDLTLIKKKPEAALNIEFVAKENEADKGLFEDKFVRFAYRWKFENGQYSVFSPFSTVAFSPGNTNAYDIEEGYNLQMLNNISQVKLSNFETINGVESIDILYKESSDNNIYVYKTILATDITDNATEITLSNESIYSIVPSDQILRQYDNVPKKAKAVENVSNRLVFGNYTDGLDLKNYSPDFTISIDNRATGDLSSIKSGRNYQFGVLFEDKYGRQSPVVSNDTGSYFRDFNDLGTGKQFKVQLNDFANPGDIDKFKYYIKSTEKEFYNIIVSEAYNDVDAPDDFIWLVIPSYEINKLQEEDFIILKKAANSSVALNNPDLKYKVLDIQSSKPENLAPNKTFPDKFFVKLKKDSFLTDALLSQQGLAGSSGIIEDTPNNENWSITTNGMSSDPLMLMWYELYGNRETYYYQDGKIYIDTTQADEQSSDTFPEDLDTITPGASCVSGAGEDWRQIKTNISFTDSLGNVVTDVYVRLIEGGATVLAAEAFAICYENASEENTESNPAIFETIPDNDLLDVYYETEESYPIDEIDQEKTIQWFNCFDLGNGVESNRIRDDFNEKTIDKQVRVSTTIAEQFKEKENKFGLIWSGIFNSRNGINRLNQFNTGQAITKDLNPEYGSIQLLHTRDTDLISFCEDKVLRILANKDALYNADGSTNITASNNVLGQAVPYGGEFGISKNPESFAYYGYQAYFTDKARGAVLRLSRDGLTLLSSKNMNSYFRDKLKAYSDLIIGSYDIHTKQYILSFKNNENPENDESSKNDESLAFSEAVDGWTTMLSFVPESGLYLNGDYFTFNNAELWKHHDSGNTEFPTRNNFYGIQYESYVKFIFNNEPSVVKNFKTLAYEGTQGKNLTTDGWQATSIETDLQSGKVTYFKGKEGKWFNNIEGISNTLSNIDSKEFSVQGIGSVSSITTPVTTTTIPATTTTTIPVTTTTTPLVTTTTTIPVTTTTTLPITTTTLPITTTTLPITTTTFATTTTTTLSTTTTCAAAGILLNTYCVGEDLYGTYTNGSCGTYNSLIEQNSSSCATTTCTPNGTFLYTQCAGSSGYDLYYVYADGNCGTYSVLMEADSSSCDPYVYYYMNGCPGTNYDGQQILARTTSNYTTAQPETSSSVSIYGSCFYASTPATRQQWEAGTPELGNVTIGAPTDVGCNSCMGITTTTTTEFVPPSNNAFALETENGNLGHYVYLVQGYSVNDYVTSDVYPGECFVIIGETYVATPSGYITGSCTPPPPVTTTTTQASTCEGVQLYVSLISGDDAACNQTVTKTVYLNSTSLASATQVYGTNSDCSSLGPGTRYYADPAQTNYYIWNGTSLSGPFVGQCQ